VFYILSVPGDYLHLERSVWRVLRVRTLEGLSYHSRCPQVRREREWEEYMQREREEGRRDREREEREGRGVCLFIERDERGEDKNMCIHSYWERRGERRSVRGDSGGGARKRGRQEHGERMERRDVIFYIGEFGATTVLHEYTIK
jgi:hypothetical protein